MIVFGCLNLSDMNIFFEHLQGFPLIFGIMLLMAVCIFITTLFLLIRAYQKRRELQIERLNRSIEIGDISKIGLSNNPVLEMESSYTRKIRIYKKIMMACFVIVFNIILFFVNRERYQKVERNIQIKVDSLKHLHR